jgi:tetratricopeptide (TPR) repeat protein
MFTKTTLATSIAVQTLFLLFFLAPAPASAQTAAPAPSNFYANRGQERYASGKLEKAISDFDRVLIMEPRNAAILNARGLTWLGLKDYGMAIRDFNQAIRQAIKPTPELATAYAHRGLARLRQGREAKASADFAKCIEIDSSLREYVEELKGNGSPRLAIHR